VDFVAGRDRLSLEQTAHEINWSIGSALDSATVAQAFHMQDSLALMQRSDATPMASLDINFWRNVLMFLVVMAIVVILVTQCTSQPQYDPNGSTSSSNSHVYFGSGYSPRSSGGSWGGQSGGGGHK